MQFDQLLRRLGWRARRRLGRAADNDPMVSVEAAASPPSPPRARRGGGPSILLILLGLLLIAWGALIATQNS